MLLTCKEYDTHNRAHSWSPFPLWHARSPQDTLRNRIGYGPGLNTDFDLISVKSWVEGLGFTAVSAPVMTPGPTAMEAVTGVGSDVTIRPWCNLTS